MKIGTYFATTLAALAFSATASMAITVEIPGSINGSLSTNTLTVAAGSNTVTFEALNNNRDLRVSTGLGAALGNGICGDAAGSGGDAGAGHCKGAMSISFADPVKDLRISQTNIGTGTAQTVDITYLGGNVSLDSATLVDTAALLPDGRVFDFGDYNGITSLSFATTCCVTTSTYFANINFNETTPVPLPAAGLLLLGGMGSLAFAARRRAGSAPKA